MMLQCFFKSNSFWFEFTLSFDVHHKNIFFCENIWSIKSPSLFLKVKSYFWSSPWSKKVLWESRQNPRNITVKEKARSLQLYWKWIPSQIFFKDLLLFFKISKNIFFYRTPFSDCFPYLFFKLHNYLQKIANIFIINCSHYIPLVLTPLKSIPSYTKQNS